MKSKVLLMLMLTVILTACAPVDLNAPIPVFDTGVDPSTWVKIPAGEFFSGQAAKITPLDYDYEVMITDVTVRQYSDYLTSALASGAVKVGQFNGKPAIVGHYPGDAFHGVKHEEKIDPGDWIYIPLDDPSSHFTFDGKIFAPMAGFDNHPMTNVTWFGGWAYCIGQGGRLPTELEWEKAARGSTDARAFPWGEDIEGSRANYYASRDPFENMTSFGSRTSPVGFYNGKVYDGFQTISNVSPYGIFDMAGNVWQWVGNVYEGMHYRFLRGGSKDVYDMDLRIWVRNNATPTYFSPGVGFRCAR